MTNGGERVFDRLALEPTTISIKVGSCQTDCSPCLRIAIYTAVIFSMSDCFVSPALRLPQHVRVENILPGRETR